MKNMIYRVLPPEEFNDLASRILYEDNHLLIVNKKVGEIVQGDKTSDEPLTETYKAFIAQRDIKPGQVFMGRYGTKFVLFSLVLLTKEFNVFFNFVLV